MAENKKKILIVEDEKKIAQVVQVNLMMAGRCISTDRETNSALRVKASCMAMGEAAATAAAVALKDGVSVRDVSIEKVKATLDQNGAIIPGKERTFESLFSR